MARMIEIEAENLFQALTKINAEKKLVRQLPIIILSINPLDFLEQACSQ